MITNIQELRPEKSSYKNAQNERVFNINEENTASIFLPAYGKELKQVIEPKKIDVSVFDVAAYILKEKGGMTTMKLHKLLYYTQAWSLVWDEKPLFMENVEAWANGPVIKELFNFHKGSFNIQSVSIGNADLLDAAQKETVDSVLSFYGDKSSQWLIELTHLENPWKEARKGLALTERGNRIITHDSMAQYYSSL